MDKEITVKAFCAFIDDVRRFLGNSKDHFVPITEVADNAKCESCPLQKPCLDADGQTTQQCALLIKKYWVPYIFNRYVEEVQNHLGKDKEVQLNDLAVALECADCPIRDVCAKKDEGKTRAHCLASLTKYWLPTQKTVVQTTMPGMKFDGDKLDWSLIPWKQMEEVARVMMFGVKKYERDNWKKLDYHRLESALLRHVLAYLGTEQYDPETKLSHLAHAICNCLFLLWKEENNEEENICENR